MNSPGYLGINFDEDIGIWMHLSTGSNFGYDVDGLLTNYSYSRQGWYDRAWLTAKKVSEPGVLVLFALGLLGLGLARRRA